MMRIINLFKSRFISHSPFRLVHDITYECNCTCIICERWKKQGNTQNELLTNEIFQMLDDGKKAGMIIYVVEGGEPLYRKDLPEILRYAKQLKYITSVVTNGFYLKNRYNEILPFTDSLVISIDSNDTLHDKLRGVKGLHKRAIEGITLSQKYKTKMFINSILSNKNLNKIKGLVQLSEDLNVPIIFQPMDIYKGYNEHLRPTQKELHTTFTQIIQMKKAGYKVWNSYRYLNNIVENKNYVCHAPKCYSYIEPNGNIVSCCDIIDKIWGNVKNNQFADIFKSKEFKEFCIKKQSCNECSVYAVIEASLAYSINPFNKQHLKMR